MNKAINNLLRPFGVALYGINHIKRLERTKLNKDAFVTQTNLVNRGAVTVFDVGANKGLISEKYLQVLPECKIYAFEPFAESYNDFNNRHASNENVHLYEFALAGHSGSATLFTNESPDTNSLLRPTEIGASSDKLCKNKGACTVQTETIDNFCVANKIEQIDILKIDTQGSELDVLKGSRKLLEKKSIGIIYTECYFREQYESQPLFPEIALYLQKYGYFLEDFYDPFYNESGLLWCDAIFILK